MQSVLPPSENAVETKQLICSTTYFTDLYYEARQKFHAQYFNCWDVINRKVRTIVRGEKKTEKEKPTMDIEPKVHI